MIFIFAIDLAGDPNLIQVLCADEEKRMLECWCSWVNKDTGKMVLTYCVIKILNIFCFVFLFLNLKYRT